MSDFRRGTKVRFTRHLRESGLIPGRVKVSRFDLEVLPPRTGEIITARGW